MKLVYVIYAVLRDSENIADGAPNAQRVGFQQMLRYQRLYYNEEGALLASPRHTDIRYVSLQAGEKPKNSIRRLADCTLWRMLYNRTDEDSFKSLPQLVAQQSPYHVTDYIQFKNV